MLLGGPDDYIAEKLSGMSGVHRAVLNTVYI